jgi:DNA-binding CsgD family transcriptional regulator
MGTSTQAGLLEREAELDALQAAVEDGAGGTGRLVVIEGDAGIGKSRLLEAAAEAAERSGMEALSARGTELERDFPFALVSQLFGPPVRAASDAAREEFIDDAARRAAAVIGIEPGDVGADYPEDASFAVLNALFWLTSNLAERKPLFLAVDDAQWSDQASLRYLLFLLPRLGDLPVSLALTVRTGESSPELLAKLVSDPAARVLRPSPLGSTSVAEVVRQELAAGAADSFCAACEEASGGNPFMLHELLRELHADGFQGSEGDAAKVLHLAPESIHRAVLARLARVSEDARALARATAVLGDDAELRAAAELAGVGPDESGTAADVLASIGILETGRPLRFAHPLLRNSVYADLSPTERARLHRRAAEQLLDGDAPPERVAVHLLETDPGDDPQVVETLTAAAARAIAQGASEAARAYARRALAEPAPPAARPALLRALLRASYGSMDPAAVAELDTSLLEELTGDRQTLYDIASELGPILLATGRTDQGMALLEKAKAAALEAEDYDWVITFEAKVEWWADLRDKERPDWDRYAAHLAADSPGQPVRLAMKAYAGARGSEPAANVVDWAARAAAEGSALERTRDAAITILPIWVLIRADGLDQAAEALDRWSRTAKLLGPAPVIAGIFLRGSLAYARGQIALAESNLRDAVDRARAVVFISAVADWIGELVEVLTERGELDAAEQELEISGLTGALPDRIRFSRALHARGCLRLAQGRTAEGLEDLTTLSERFERFDWSNPLYPTDAVRAIALAGAGETEAAREAAEKYSRAAEHWGTPRTKGIARHCRGIVEGGDQGIELLQDSVATLRHSPAELELARALTDLGASLRRDNQRAAAREPLREALEIARRTGALAVGQLAHDELDATGEKLRPLMASGVESLTPSERRVAEMAATGKTNRAIAQELYLTVKTIEAHLSSAYRKLDIASRSELSDALGGPVAA